MNTLVVIESICAGYTHAPINAAFLNKICKSKEYKKVKFVAENTHISAVKEIIDQNLVDEIIFIPIKTNQNVKFFKILYFDFVLFSKFIKQNDNNIFITTLTVTNLISIKLLMLFFKNISVKMVPHAILSSLILNENVSFFRKIKRLPLLLFSFKLWFFNFNSYRLKYQILGVPIAKNLFFLNKNISKYCYVKDHPKIYNSLTHQKKFNNKKIKIGFLGVGSEEKGIDKFIEIIDKLNQQVNIIEFYLIGRLNKEYQCPDDLNLVSKNNTMIDKQKMDSISNEMDFFVFLLQDENFKLRASGTFFDAINYEKPIISLSTDFTDYYLEEALLQKLIFKNTEEIIIYISNLNEMSLEEYKKLTNKIFNLKVKLDKEQ